MQQTFFSRHRNVLLPTIFIGPAILIMLVVIVYPLVFSLVSSFYELNIAKSAKMKPVGIRNYAYILRHPLFFKSFLTTMTFAVWEVPLSYVFGMMLALTLHTGISGIKPLRALLLTPMMVAPVILGMMFRIMFNDTFGVINYLLGVVGISGPLWLADGTWAIRTVILLGVWGGIPFNMIILLAGLQSIPDELFEAARIDGCSPVQAFRHITFPMLKPPSIVCVTLGLINAIKIFDAVFSLTEGGPGTATITMTFYSYTMGFAAFRLGRAAASANVIFVIIMILTAGFILLTGGLKSSET
jgi:multiple sugar transport system permease protein